MVTFRFSKKSYEANERDAIRVLQYYKKYLTTFQVVKAWTAKGAIQPGKRKTYGWAKGKNKVVGYSLGKGPNQINARMLNFMVRETQASVNAALTNSRSQYGQNLAVIYKPASFTTNGSKMEFEVNIFFDAKGLTFYKKQQRL